MANEDKIKALDSMITKLDKDYGKGTVMKLGDKPNVGMDAVPTGSLLLDKALGIGGIPKGRIIEIYGPESSGKCLTEDSLVLTPEGYKTITEIFKENNLETECVEKIIPVKYPLINKDGNIENTKNFTFNGEKKVYKVTTKTGLEIKGTSNHPLLVINGEGFPVWRDIGKIQSGDTLITRKGDKYSSNDKKISKDEAILLGMFTANIAFLKDKLFFRSDNEWMENFFLETIKNIEELKDIKIRKFGNCFHMKVEEKISEFRNKYGLQNNNRITNLPDTVRFSNIETQKAFLKGYFECTSYIGEDNSIEVISFSKNLLREVQLMLRNMGIVSFLTSRENENYLDNICYVLNIYEKYVQVFKDEVGFFTKEIKDFHFTEDTIPNIKNIVISYYDSIDPSFKTEEIQKIIIDLVSDGSVECSRDKLLKFLQYDGNKQLKELLLQYTDETLYFDKVEDVEYVGDLPTFDVEMEKTHTFICESIINHNTTLTLHIIAEAQKAGGIAGFIDAEHALDPVYARNIGVDVDNLYVSQPDCGEQALEVAEAFVRSGAMDIVVVDSVAALTPKKEIEGEMGEATVGLQARLMSQALRKLTAVVSKTNCTVIFINQLREKIGVMFGCIHGSTLLNFTDGRSIPMKEVVEKEIKGSVWSYNEKLKTFEAKEIIDWHYNGDIENQNDYIHFQTVGIETNGGRFGFSTTPNHKIMTNNGWKEARQITIEDKLLSKYNSLINETLESFLWGTLIGDSTIRRRDKNTACISFQDSKNREYVLWKLEKLKEFYNFKKVSNRFDSNYNFELSLIKDELLERDPSVMLKNHYSDLGLALWYMDDGHLDLKNSHSRCSISVKRFKNKKDKLYEIKDLLESRGIKVSRISEKDGNLIFNKEDTINLMKRIHTYVPECMQYKLLDEFRNKYEDFKLTSTTKIKEHFVRITEIREISKTQFKQKGKYDISVKDNHNYVVGGITNGILVHNSPETTTGGRALKFYSSVRLDIRRIETLKKDGQSYGNKTRVRVVKNKVAPPFQEAVFDIVFGKGIDSVGEIVDIGVEFNFIVKSGSWYSLPDGTKLGQGKDNAKQYLLNNPEILENVKKQINEKMEADFEEETR